MSGWPSAVIPTGWYSLNAPHVCELLCCRGGGGETKNHLAERVKDLWRFGRWWWGVSESRKWCQSCLDSFQPAPACGHSPEQLLKNWIPAPHPSLQPPLPLIFHAGSYMFSHFPEVFFSSPPPKRGSVKQLLSTSAGKTKTWMGKLCFPKK